MFKLIKKILFKFTPLGCILKLITIAFFAYLFFRFAVWYFVEKRKNKNAH